MDQFAKHAVIVADAISIHFNKDAVGIQLPGRRLDIDIETGKVTDTVDASLTDSKESLPEARPRGGIPAEIGKPVQAGVVTVSFNEETAFIDMPYEAIQIDRKTGEVQD